MKYLQVRAKDPKIIEKGENGGAVTAILKSLLDSKKVDGVLNISKGNNLYDGIPTYTTDSSKLIDTAGSLHCAPTMISDIIARYLKEEIIAVTTKPCDAMAIDEIIKRVGIDITVSPESAVASYLERIITRPKVSDLIILGRGSTELLDVKLENKDLYGKRVLDYSPTENYIICAVYEDNELIIPQEDTVFHENQKISVITKS